MTSRRRLVVFLLSLCFVAAFVGMPRGIVAQSARADGPRFMPNEVIVKYHYGVPAAAKSRALARASAHAIDRVSVTPAAAAEGDVDLVHTPLNVPDAIERLRSD